jgi:hypothetical protein
VVHRRGDDTGESIEDFTKMDRLSAKIDRHTGGLSDHDRNSSL